jgi:putative oxidoreductase
MTSQSLTYPSTRTDTSPWRRLLVTSLATTPSYGPVVLRLALAGVMFPHGAQKLLGAFGGYGFSGTMGFFASMGLPAPVSAGVILLEFFAPILLVLGLGTRGAALGLAGVMLGAIATVHAPNGFFMDWAGTRGAEGFEYHLLAIGIALALVVSGAGRFGLDGKLAARLAGRRAG